MKRLLHSGVFCLYIYICIYICMRVGAFFSALAVLSVIVQLFFSARSLNGGFTIGQRPHSNGITPFVFFHEYFNCEKGGHRTTFFIF